MSRNFKRKKRITFKSTEPVFGWDYYNKMKKEAQANSIEANQFVYLIKSATGLFKIGISTDPRSRLNQISSASGFDAELIAYYKTEDLARSVEKKLHKLFEKYHVRGEWFDFPDTYTLEKFETICDKFGMTSQPLLKEDNKLLVGVEVAERLNAQDKKESLMEWINKMNKDWEESKKKDG